jgi:pantoate--beta-alanine ligase
VLKLLEIVQPSFAFFGRKDAQQERVIRRMVADLNLDAQIVTCATMRDADGLALSSRNAYLKGDERRAALSLFRALDAIRKKIEAGDRDVIGLAAALRQTLEAERGISIDYAEIVDAESFEPAMTLGKTAYAVLAARVGSTRLIDNALIEPAGDALRVTV